MSGATEVKLEPFRIDVPQHEVLRRRPRDARWPDQIPGSGFTRWNELPRGGHFAAMEEPDLLVEDVRAFFRALR